MAPTRKKDRLKQWLSRLFTPKGEIHYVPDGPQRHAGPKSFMDHAQDFALYNPTMTAVQGDHNTVTYVQGDRNLVPQTMKLLSDHIMLGAAHDDSARVPPPRCHPGTRINLLARITAWFNGEGRPELLLWITGPAGVGKSAVVQTFAEYLFKLKLLGASVFCSRPNKRNDPHRIFITVAYQLAIRIGEYREFIVERLSLDPQLLNRDMATQFRTFIIEPFVERKIGVGGKRWGILLDGLDELNGEDAQCETIQLISSFIHQHRDAPLVWIIASRPESHLESTFNDDEIHHCHWSEYIPIDSTEACQDVEQFLRSSFKAVQKKYRDSICGDWPSDTEFLKLTAAASGLFIYAQLVVQFISDPYHADPVSQFETVLLAIDRSNTVATDANPFAQLDALYHEILSSIPPTCWPAAKQLLHFAIYGGRVHLPTRVRVPQNFQTLRGMSILLGISRHVMYACLNKCRSTLKIPDWKVAHKKTLMFFHASFADYLKDSSRSRDYYVGDDEGSGDLVTSTFYQIWNKCSGDDIATASVGSTWLKYCSTLDGETQSKAVAKFDANLLRDVVSCLGQMMSDILRNPAESPKYVQLHKLHMIKLCYYFNAYDLSKYVDALMITNIDDTRLLRHIHLKNLKFGHLDWNEMSPAHAHFGRIRKISTVSEWMLQRPHTNTEFKAFVSELECLQKHSPELEVVIVGGDLQGRVAAFRHPLRNDTNFHHFLYYVIPYPE